MPLETTGLAYRTTEDLIEAHRGLDRAIDKKNRVVESLLPSESDELRRLKQERCLILTEITRRRSGCGVEIDTSLVKLDKVLPVLAQLAA